MSELELLKKEYEKEFSCNVGDERLWRSLLQPFIENLYENKIVYEERGRVYLIKVSDLSMDVRHFEAKATGLILIKKNPRLKGTFPDTWNFGSAWSCLHIAGNALTTYGSGLIWPEPALVKSVEELVGSNKTEEALALTYNHKSFL